MKNLACRGIAALALAPAFLCASPASAVEVSFSGSTVGSGFVAANAGCAPIPFQGTITNAPGTSPLGNFTYNHVVCTSGAAGGPVQGNFTINLGGDLLQGTLNGAASPSGTPGLSNLLFTYLISSGTGQFLSATGSFIGSGTADTRQGAPSIVTLNFGAVPEPGTWAMMLLGFGGIGITMRRRRGSNALTQIA